MLENESFLFEKFLQKSEYCVSGFSLGAIEALEYVYNNENRVDLIQLFSPAFFHDKDETFKTSQIKSFEKNEALYTKIFLKNISYPSKIDLKQYYKKDSLDRLKFLLNYRFRVELLESLRSRGIKIELYVGLKDKIIDPINCQLFFQDFATITEIKEGGHILWRD